MRKLAIGLCVVLLSASACWPFGDDAPLTEMTLRRESGTVELLRDGEVIGVGDLASLQPGDVVQADRGARAILRLQGDRIIEIAAFKTKARVRIANGARIEAQSGNLLARAQAQTEVVFGDVEASGSGATFRLDRGLASSRAAVYKGRIRLTAPGERSLSVSRLRQASIAVDDVPGMADPYRINADDPWDRQLLGHVLDLEEELTLLATGFQNQLGRQRPTLAFFRALAKGRDVSFMRPYLRRAPATDLLIAFNIALRAQEDSVKHAFKQAFKWFERGASWGVVAELLNVRGRILIAQIERIIELSTKGKDIGPEFTVAAAEEAATGPPSDGGGGAQPPDDGSEPPDDGGGNSPKPKPSEPPDECTDTIDCIAEDILPDSSPSPTPSIGP
jgi:hypothetical protein